MTDVRKGQWPGTLPREAFAVRFRNRFRDPAFAAEGAAIERLERIAREAYADGRKAPITRDAGSDHADPPITNSRSTGPAPRSASTAHAPSGPTPPRRWRQPGSDLDRRQGPGEGEGARARRLGPSQAPRRPRLRPCMATSPAPGPRDAHSRTGLTGRSWPMPASTADTTAASATGSPTRPATRRWTRTPRCRRRCRRSVAHWCAASRRLHRGELQSQRPTLPKPRPKRAQRLSALCRKALPDATDGRCPAGRSPTVA
jgi:hypothetical protein